MCARFDLGLQSGAPRWRALVCLTLIAALLYNPFLTVLSNSLEISVQHPLSYRATVASSELRRCTLQAEKPLIPALVAVVLFLAAGLALPHEVGPVQPGDSTLSATSAVLESIWVRPPPSR